MNNLQLLIYNYSKPLKCTYTVNSLICTDLRATNQQRRFSMGDSDALLVLEIVITPHTIV